MRRVALLPLLALPLLASCGREELPTGTSVPADRPSFTISDAVHSGGKEHFYFLPPLVPMPDVNGTADGALSPTVSVCEWTASGCGAEVARFTISDGTGGNTVDIDAASQHYAVNWNTKTCTWGPCALDPAKTYRLSVWVGPMQLGFADLDVVENGAELKNVQSGEYIGLVDGRTLPVKFRIEQGIIGSIGLSPDVGRISVGQTLGITALVRDLHGQLLPGPIVSWSVADGAVAGVSPTGSQGADVTGLGRGCTSVTAEAQSLIATAAVIVEPFDIAFEGVGNQDRAGSPVPLLGVGAVGGSGCDPKPIPGLVDFRFAYSQPLMHWSPDGTRLALGGTSNALAIHDFRTEGTSYLTPSGLYLGILTDNKFAWSPDGTRIAFIASIVRPDNWDPENKELFEMNADGTGARRLTSWNEDVNGQPVNWTERRYGSRPSWSPDGTMIVYQSHSNADGSNTLRMLNVLTSEDRLFVADVGSDQVSWSPAGGKIAYVRFVWNGGSTTESQLMTVNPDGTGTTLVAGNDAGCPSWSPDGSRIAYSANGFNSGPWVAKPDGSEVRLLALDFTLFTCPSWSPDGRYVVFQGYNHRTSTDPFSDRWGIWRVGVDEDSQVLLTKGVGPIWRPGPAPQP